MEQVRGDAGLMSVQHATWCGQSVERVEDAALLTGRGRFIDDLGVRTGTLHAAILRSPHAHARIKGYAPRQPASLLASRRYSPVPILRRIP